MLLRVSSLFLCRIGNDVLKQRFQFASMLARSRVDDDGSLWSGSLDLAHAEPMPFNRRRTCDAPRSSYSRLPLIVFMGSIFLSGPLGRRSKCATDILAVGPDQRQFVGQASELMFPTRQAGSPKAQPPTAANAAPFSPRYQSLPHERGVAQTARGVPRNSPTKSAACPVRRG